MSELNILALSILLGLLHLFITVAAKTGIRGLDWNMGPRDTTAKPLPEKIARLERAFENFKETFPFFVAAILLVHSIDPTSRIVPYSGLVYLIARMVYVPLYVFGVKGLRSLVWFVSVLGIIGLLGQFFLNV